MNRPTLIQAEQWRPDSLREAAQVWDRAANGLRTEVDMVVEGVDGSRDFWTGSAAEVARDNAAGLAEAARQVAQAFVEAAVAARTGADRIAAARDAALALVADARADGFEVADDGTVSAPTHISDQLRLAYGGDPDVARAVMATRATELSNTLGAALDRLTVADTDTAAGIDTAFAGPASTAASTRPSGGWPLSAADVVAAWPSMSQDRIAAQIAALSPPQKQQLITEAPHQVGNTDGVPWPMRLAANRTNIAGAIATERGIMNRPDDEKLREVIQHNFAPAMGLADVAGAERIWAVAHADPRIRAAMIEQHDRGPKERIAFYQGLLAKVDDAGGSGQLVDRQILGFDPQRAEFIELHGDLSRATSVGVLVPGLGTTVTGSAPNTQTARRFVAAGSGDVAMITYLGGPFPTGDLAAGIVDAANPRYAQDMAPRLVAFSEDVNRTVDATGRSIPVTYIGHSYGGSILGTAEAAGLTADRTIYVEAAGAGVGVHDAGDWHNRNPDVLRFAMTAPFDPIERVQGIPFGPHGADVDEMDGVVRLETGRRLDGSVMAGLDAHSDVLNEPSDAWHNVLAVITGDLNHVLHQVK